MSQMARSKAAGTSGAATRRRWWHLRQRWRMLGVFEINPEHEFYHLTAMIKEGIHASIQTTVDTPGQVKNRLFISLWLDYKHELLET